MSDELLDLGRQDIILLADRCERAEEQLRDLRSLIFRVTETSTESVEHQLDEIRAFVRRGGTS